MARNVASRNGITLREVTTAEGRDENYVRNDGLFAKLIFGRSSQCCDGRTSDINGKTIQKIQ